jgi:hypothetical protein
MKSAVPVFPLRTALLLAAAVVLSTAAAAQSDTASKQGISDEPPVRIIGWRYEKGLSGRQYLPLRGGHLRAEFDGDLQSASAGRGELRSIPATC